MIDEHRGDFPDTLARPARRALTAIGIQRLEQLTTLREDEVALLHGMGPKAVSQLRDALAARGLGFAGR